ncbi:MAG: NADH-quinone oxidoreductase subunit A [Candidatus Omnitrophica bacterium]|nr:NADH-quinone oxidoreductase subunit A [Candidatus Omnitrophota bacterium]
MGLGAPIEYGAILIFGAFSLAVALALLSLAVFFGPRKPNPAKMLPYECGKTPFALPRGKYSVKFYVVAMLFVIFDVEVIFLFPWAVVFRDLGIYGYLAMLLFLWTLAEGFIYAWRKGALDWS